MARQTVKQEMDVVRAREKRADDKRTGSQNILALGNLVGATRTQIEDVLGRVNRSKGAFTNNLTTDDLQHLKNAMDELQQSFNAMGIKGGIHPRTVIDRSRRIDIQRCENEIPTAVPATRNKYGVVVFRVNASAKSKDTHHLVSVQFLNFQAALAGGAISTKMAQQVSRGPVRIDCDCGRHRYWYRYVATVGGFAHGKPETGFPKVRNPRLAGIGCKHVLRVMLILTKSGYFTPYMMDYLKSFRDKPVAKAKTMGRKQIEKLADQIKSEAWNKKRVRRNLSAKRPENMTDAFNPNSSKAKSIAGLGMTPAQLAYAKAESMSKQQIIKELSRHFNDPALLERMSFEQLATMKKTIFEANNVD